MLFLIQKLLTKLNANAKLNAICGFVKKESYRATGEMAGFNILRFYFNQNINCPVYFQTTVSKWYYFKKLSASLGLKYQGIFLLSSLYIIYLKKDIFLHSAHN